MHKGVGMSLIARLGRKLRSSARTVPTWASRNLLSFFANWMPSGPLAHYHRQITFQWVYRNQMWGTDGSFVRNLAKWNEARAEHAQRYRELLAGIGDIRFQQQASFSTHIYHLFIIETGRRNELQKHLSGAGIHTNIHYPIPIHLQKAYNDLEHKEGDFPHAEQAAKRMLSLPMFPELTEAQINRVAKSIKEFFDKNEF